MEYTHEDLVVFAKSFGLFYLLAMSAVALIYALWPSNKKRFERAAESILTDEDVPCR